MTSFGRRFTGGCSLTGEKRKQEWRGGKREGGTTPSPQRPQLIHRELRAGWSWRVILPLCLTRASPRIQVDPGRDCNFGQFWARELPLAEDNSWKGI